MIVRVSSVFYFYIACSLVCSVVVSVHTMQSSTECIHIDYNDFNEHLTINSIIIPVLKAVNIGYYIFQHMPCIELFDWHDLRRKKCTYHILIFLLTVSMKGSYSLLQGLGGSCTGELHQINSRCFGRGLATANSLYGIILPWRRNLTNLIAKPAQVVVLLTNTAHVVCTQFSILNCT